MRNFYPLKMAPVFKDYLWGGNRLVTEWNKSSPYINTAESWELASHKDGESTVAEGPLKGKTLNDVVALRGKKILGHKCEHMDRFPILIKFIDPKDKLSIQVHPDDEYALKNENDSGKTELWYIADADMSSSILCGFKQNVDSATFQKAIKNNTLPELMNKIKVKKGDVYFINPGTLHAICENSLIVEIQQNSNVTYRVCDYGRKDSHGRTRDLHIDKAIEVTKLEKEVYDGKSPGGYEVFDWGTSRMLAECKYFIAKEYTIGVSPNNGSNTVFLEAGSSSFQSLVFVEGKGSIIYEGGETEYKKGDTFFIPADFNKYAIKGEGTFLMVEV